MVVIALCCWLPADADADRIGHVTGKVTRYKYWNEKIETPQQEQGERAISSAPSLSSIIITEICITLHL